MLIPSTDKCPFNIYYMYEAKKYLESLQTNLRSLTRAGIPPDLKMANKPCLWCERLCNVPAAQRVVSKSLVLLMALTSAATICGEFIMACRLASFLDS